MDDRDKIIKDAQYRKGASIAFFNATNSAITLVAQHYKPGELKPVLDLISVVREHFLQEYQKYYATNIANIGGNYDVREGINILEKATNYAELQIAWVSLSQDERKDKEIQKVAKELKSKFKDEKTTNKPKNGSVVSKKERKGNRNTAKGNNGNAKS